MSEPDSINNAQVNFHNLVLEISLHTDSLAVQEQQNFVNRESFSTVLLYSVQTAITKYLTLGNL